MDKLRSTLVPRKVPAQARSRATVDAIIQAATYILTEAGWEGVTTNAIAERAGVNIGSLYQFFPNKEAVVAEVQRRHAVETRADLRLVLKRLSEQDSLRGVLSLIVEMVINEHRIAPAVHKAISDELPPTLRSMREDTELLRAQFTDALMPFMTNVPDPKLATYIVGITAHAIVHTVTAERSELLDSPMLLAELTTLLENYLCRS